MKTNQKGAVVLILMIIISAITLIIALSLGLSSITENQIGLYQSTSGRFFLNIDGCIEESLIKLSRDDAYSGEILNIENTLCNISVAGVGSSRTITVTASNSDYSRTIQVGVEVSPVMSINSWQELTN